MVWVEPEVPAATSGSGVAVTSGVGVRRLSGRRGTLGDLVQHGSQRQLAARVDLGDLDLDLLADAEHVLDVLDALAPDHPADLRDVQQPVLARNQGDEGTEGRRLHDGPQVTLADLRHGRVGDRVDRRPGRLGRGAVGRADVDGPVVLDRDVRAGVLLDLVDHLALRPDDLADLVYRNLDADHPRSEL